MQWTMPSSTLKIVAGLLALVALAAFGMGIANTPQRGGRLPGEQAKGSEAPVSAIQATEATPLGEERIEGPPPPRELTAEEKAKLEDEKQAKADALAQAAAGSAVSGIVTPKLAVPPADHVGDLLDGVTPPPEEPPH